MSRRRRRARDRASRARGRAGGTGPPEPPRPDLPPPHPFAGPIGGEPAAPGSDPDAGPATAAAAFEAAPDAHGHLPVLVAESLDLLDVRPGDVVVDCTAGRGGHARRLAAAASAGGTLVLVDLDADNLAYAVARAEAMGAARVLPLHGRFDAIPGFLREHGLVADAVFADLGFCSNQIDDPARGFSFGDDGPLDMRLDRSSGPTAAELLAHISEHDLAELLRDWGEEPLARRIASNVVAARTTEPITSTAALADLVVAAYGPRAKFSRLHPATRTFMAIRIAVNGELEAVRSLLASIADEADALADEGSSDAPGGAEPRWLRPGSRVAVISFHSLEDRVVKQVFRGLADREAAVRLTRKPQLASHAEVRANPRSRSAKIRAVLVGCVTDGRSSSTAGDTTPADDPVVD